MLVEFHATANDSKRPRKKLLSEILSIKLLPVVWVQWSFRGCAVEPTSSMANYIKVYYSYFAMDGVYYLEYMKCINYLEYL